MEEREVRPSGAIIISKKPRASLTEGMIPEDYRDEEDPNNVYGALEINADIRRNTQRFGEENGESEEL